VRDLRGIVGSGADDALGYPQNVRKCQRPMVKRLSCLFGQGLLSEADQTEKYSL
jgi:hypothetical protein